MTRTVAQELFSATFFIDDSGVSLNNTGSQVSIDSSIFKENLIWPAYVVLGCIVLRLFNVVSQARWQTRWLQKEGYNGLKNSDISGYVVSGSYLEKFKKNLKRLGIPIVVSRALRLIGIVLLVVVSFLTLGQHPNYQDKLVQIELIHLALYVFQLVLAVLTLLPARFAEAANDDLTIVLLSFSLVYLYRDIYPFFTYALAPEDSAAGQLLWFRVGLILITGILIPLFTPRQYKPLDPLNPQKDLSPEQTASLASFFTWSYMDPLVWKAARSSNLEYEDLPPIADYDRAEYLAARSQKIFKRYFAKKRHIFLALMRIFSKEAVILSFATILKSTANFISPLALNQLLLYIQDSSNAYYRPWTWVLIMFLGPMASCIAFEYYIYKMMHVTVQLEGILTQLVFDHSLQIRVKEEKDPKQDKGKAKDSAESSPRTKTRGSNLVGKINNLITTDLLNITSGRHFIYVFITVPLHLLYSLWFLYKLIGWSALVGMSFTVITMPLPAYFSKYLLIFQKRRLEKTDARVQTITDVLSVARMIKLFGWEDRVSKQIEEKREAELSVLKKRQLLSVVNSNLNYFLPLITMIGTFGCYVRDMTVIQFVSIMIPFLKQTIIQKQTLTAATVFSSIAVFSSFREVLWMTFYFLPEILNGHVSLSRINNFIKNTELLDRLSEDKTLNPEAALPQDTIGFRNAKFTWSKDDLDNQNSGEERKFQLTIENDVMFRRGQLNLIIGPTGSGKTSLLMALLGEMHYSPIADDSGYRLPRDGGVAFVAQEGWVQSGTIKDNILFGSELDEERYKKVIFQSGLEQDLALFEAGDETEIGERGFTLSGGQNARVTLARAIYSKAEIILIDDILACLDVHTGKFIVDNCFNGDLLKGRTVILVTHNVSLVAPVADFVVSLDMSGQIASQGNLNDALSKNERLLEEVMQEQGTFENEEKAVVNPDAKTDVAEKKGGKLVLAEEVAIGHVSWDAMKLYYSNAGGFLYWFTVVSTILFSKALTCVGSWLLGRWAADYENHPPESVSPFFYLSVYGVIMIFEGVLYAVGMSVAIFGSIRASRALHRMLSTSVLRTTLRWLDTVPTARVIARCTQDIAAVDGPIANYTQGWILTTSVLITSFGTIMITVPRFVIPGFFIAVLGFLCGQLYMKAQLPIKRQMSNHRSPIIAQMNAMITGIVSIRAYGAETPFRKDNLRHIEGYIRPARAYYDCNRWVAVRTEALGATLAAALAFYILNDRSQSASSGGLALGMAVTFSSCILDWVRITNDLEVQGNSIERIESYVNIVQEPKPSASGAPPAYWPASGSVVVENLCARYSADSPEVLHKLNFTIKSGEKIGVVGRTGSGKSTLTLSLLRCIPTEGKVLYDGLDTGKINLESLRRNITIIPQRPELLTGTLRDNLDPFSEHSDTTLNDALRLSGLFALQEQNDQVAKLSLDSTISSGGSNLSVGQRQILALARAILRGSKLLILDEATSAIDYATDAIIQNSLREASRDSTLLIVAHRLNTIMDADKIILLDAGNMVEFDSPANLLKKPDGYFKSLVDESGDRDILYKIAEEKAHKSGKV